MGWLTDIDDGITMYVIAFSGSRLMSTEWHSCLPDKQRAIWSQQLREKYNSRSLVAGSTLFCPFDI